MPAHILRMQHGDHLTIMKQFILDTIGYYQRFDYHPHGGIIFSRQMAAVVLPELPTGELHIVLRKLACSGLIIILDEESLNFTPAIWAGDGQLVSDAGYAAGVQQA